MATKHPAEVGRGQTQAIPVSKSPQGVHANAGGRRGENQARGGAVGGSRRGK